MHDIQHEILKQLLFSEKLRFSELNINNISNDHFSFHINRLLEEKLVAKDEEGLYSLTVIGKEYANRLDVDSGKTKIERQAKIGGVVVCTRDSQKQYLMQQRLKQPYYGFFGFISGKIKWGEPVLETAKRELKEESGLDGDLNLSGIEHKIDYSQNNELLEDKFFYIFEATNLIGNLSEEFEGGRNAWKTKQEIKELPEIFDDVLLIIDLLEKKEFKFWENKFIVKRY